MSPEMQDVEPAAAESPPHDLERVRLMVENGIQAVEAGLQAGTSEFHKFAKDAEGVLDHHGFKAWRANHSEGCDPAELDELEARAVVDPDVESDEARAARVAAEEAAAAPAKPDPMPASEAAAPVGASGASGAQSAEAAPGASASAASETETPAV